MNGAIMSREESERVRQIVLIKNYFTNRQRVFEARLKQFLRLYPYSDGISGTDLHRFEMAVTGVEPSQRIAILQAFQNEKNYWNSGYVIKNCDSKTLAHIISTLNAMETILNRVGYSCRNSAVTSYPLKTDRDLSVKTPVVTEKNSQKKPVTQNWGHIGEKAVDYVLKWLPDDYYVIAKDCRGKYDDDVIILKNDSFMDEPQEFDHLVIGPQGVFNIETKNYSGKLAIDQSGNWSRLKKGDTDWSAEVNPAQQIFRHRMLLKSIIGDSVPIIDIICMAHPDLMICGQDNSKIPVIKKELLDDYIVNCKPTVLSRYETESVIARINASKISE